MSLVKLANGRKFEIESPTGLRDGILRQRERKILPLVFKEDADIFPTIRAAFADPANTETITVYYHESDPDKSDDVLDAEKGPASKVYEGFTIPGEVKEEDRVIREGTPESPPEYGRQLTIELGERQFGE